MSISISGLVTIADKRMDSEIVWYNLYSCHSIGKNILQYFFFYLLRVIGLEIVFLKSPLDKVKWDERKNIFYNFKIIYITKKKVLSHA